MKYAISIILFIGFSLNISGSNENFTETTTEVTSVTTTAENAENVSDTASVHRNIDVEKNYIPEVKNIRRPHVELKAKEPQFSKNEVKYSEYETFINPKSVFNPLPQTDLRVLRRKPTDKGFAQAAFGFPLKWNAELFYPILNKRQTNLSIHGVHDAIITKKKLLDTDVSIDLSQSIGRNTLLFANVNYSNLYYNYYGSENMPADSISYYNIDGKKFRGDSIFNNTQTIHSVNANIGVKNINSRSDLFYDVRANYQFSYFKTNSLNEHVVDVYGGISKKLLDIHSLNIYADVNATIYNNPLNAAPTQSKTNTVIGIYPSYSIQWENLRVKAGAKIFISTPNGTTVTGSPDVHASYLFRDIFDLSIGFDGNYNINNLSSIIKENRYYNPNLAMEENTYSPFKAYFSMNVKPVKGLLINAYTNFSIIKNQYFFVNQHFQHIIDPSTWTTSATESLQSNLFTADICNANLLKAGISAKYNHKEKYIAYAQFDYTKGFSKDANVKPWYLPAFKVKAGGRVEAIKHLFINLDFNFESGRIYKIQNNDGSAITNKLNNVYDLNLSAYYSILSKYTIFVKANNLLGNIPSVRYSQWYGYEDIGCNVLFGFNLSF